MGLWTFVIYASIGGLLWTGLLAGAGYLLKENYEQVEHWLNPVTTGVIVLIVVLYLYRLVRGLAKRRA
jgi:membrane protein DedA with SNARE-associated domain